MTNIFIQSYGCSASMNDGEIMAGLLEKAGHKLVSEPSKADIIIINTCIVKGKTENRMKKILADTAAQYPKKKIILTGCLPQVGIPIQTKTAAMIGPHNITQIAGIVDCVLNGKMKRAIGNKSLIKVALPKKPKNPYVNIVQILEGCSGACTYCIVKQAKPVLSSFEERLIVDEIRNGLAQGAHEIWLTSQDNASFEMDRKAKSSLPHLLISAAAVEGKFFIRMGMMNPDTILPVLDDLAEAYSSPKVFKFLHIPVQSGSNRILKLMGRKYTIGDFKSIIRKFRKTFPNISISTDIIVGFPSETEAEFRDSLSLISWLKPDVLNISRFFPRPNTPAARMGSQIHGSITKLRSAELARLFDQISSKRNQRWLGWQGEMYVDESGQKGTFVGRNCCYRPIVVKTRRDILGKFIKVEITAIQPTYLIGSIIS